MFDNDLNKDQYQQKYKEMQKDFLETLIAEIDNKMKKCVERIEGPLPEQELNKDHQEQIIMINKKISELISKAEHFGEIALIDDSETVMRNIERLKEQKNEILNLNEHPMMFKEKQMKVCEIFGAMQSTQDNEKRLQTHFEGKLYSGYLKIREYLDLLRRRKLERKFKREEEKQKEKLERGLKEKERERKRKRNRSRSRSKDYIDKEKIIGTTEIEKEKREK